MFLYRDANQCEIDVLLEENGTLYPIEIKRTANPGSGEYQNFRELAKLQKKTGLGAVLCLKDERIPLSRDLVSIPVWEILTTTNLKPSLLLRLPVRPVPSPGHKNISMNVVFYRNEPSGSFFTG